MRLELVQSLFHSGKYSTRSKGLIQVEPSGAVRMNPEDGTRLGINAGDRIRLSNGCGAFAAPVQLAARVPQGTLWYPDSFAQEAAGLFECIVDPDTKVPSFRTAQVSVGKIG